MDKSMAVNVGNDTMVCTGSPVPLKALAPAGSAFLWRPNYTLSNTTIYNPVATPAIDTFYWVEATLNGCSGYDTIYIRHHPQPQVNAGTDTFSCRNQPLSLTIGSSAWLADSFFWWPTSGISNPNSLQTQAIITPSEYVLTGVVKSTGCSAYDTLSLRSVVPKADFITDPSIVQAPQLVKCTNTSSANPAQPMSFIWQMGSPSEYFYTKDVQYTFTKEGKYDITLRAYINSGCYDSITKTIDVVGAFNIFIPNAFTPNGNGVNDVFEIKYTKDLLSEMRGSIWNRWGDKIYDFYMPGGSWWNGKVGSEYAQDEVYFYLLQVTTLTGKQLNFHGTVTLLR
jgi:gliding motility-associated-like protein